MILALDFDGVLVDSAPEIFEVAVRTWAALEPRSRLLDQLLDDGDVRAFDTVPAKLRSSFSRLIPFGNRAEDFGAALAALDRGRQIEDQAAYDAFFASCGRSWLDTFHHTFYVERSALREGDTRRWLELHRAYPTFLELLTRRRGELQLAIATSKDRSSVRLLLDHNGIGELIDDHLVFDKELGPDKAVHVRRIAHRLESRPDRITFVDDKIRHLENVSRTGARTILAAWGHTTDSERARAAAAGFPVATLDTAEAVIMPPK